MSKNNEVVSVVISTREINDDFLKHIEKKFSHPKTQILIYENDGVDSLTQIYKKSKIPMKEIDTILVRLICWKLVYLEITENNSFSQFISYL